MPREIGVIQNEIYSLTRDLEYIDRLLAIFGTRSDMSQGLPDKRSRIEYLIENRKSEIRSIEDGGDGEFFRDGVDIYHTNFR